MIKEKQCGICSKTFIPKQKTQKYCGYECSYEAMKRKALERKKVPQEKREEEQFVLVTKHLTYIGKNKIGVNLKNLQAIIKQAKDKNWEI